MDEWSRRSDLNRGSAVPPAIRADRARVVFPGHVISTSQCLVDEQSAHEHRDRTGARPRDHGSVRRANQDIFQYLTPVGRMAHTFDMAKGKDEAQVFNDGACSYPLRRLTVEAMAWTLRTMPENRVEPILAVP